MLHLAARENQIEVIQLLKRSHKSVNAEQRNGVGYTAAMCAANAGRAEALRMLVDLFDVDLQTFDENDYSCLHLAAASGHIGVVSMLLDDYKVPVDLRVDGSKTTLHVAAQFGHADVTRLLLSKGAAIDCVEERFRSTPLVQFSFFFSSKQIYLIYYVTIVVGNIQSASRYGVATVVGERGRIAEELARSKCTRTCCVERQNTSAL